MDQTLESTTPRYNSNYKYEYMSMLSSMPIHLCFFMVVLGFSWYINYESKYDDSSNKVKLYLMLSPLVLLLIVQFYCSVGRSPHMKFPVPEERESVHRAGGFPWGVPLLVIFLLWVISHSPHYSSLHDRWFPTPSK
ncbi:hypothetical protein ACFE04_006261 [Oxalis oulophora]